MTQPPLRDGWVEIADGRVVDIGAGPCDAAVDLGSTAILPGLVNAHTHLELSYLARCVPPAAEFTDWIRGVVALRRTQTDPRSAQIMQGISQGISQAIAAGTALVGDISNTLVTFDPIVRSGLAGVVFHELIRFNAPDPHAVVADACRQLGELPSWPGILHVSLAAHAPYSVSPGLFGQIARSAAAHEWPISVHLSESPAELEFIGRGTGAWRRFLDDVGAWDPDWCAPGTTPVQYLDSLGVLTERTIAVHGVQMSRADLEILRMRGVTLVTCPRSNAHTGAGVPPIAAFYDSGVRVAVGTDSLASSPDLSVFAEMAAIRKIAPGVTARRILQSATLHGAVALGFGDHYGAAEPGKRARLLAVAIPPSVDDVEEYLVGGVEPDAIGWLAETR